VWALVPAKGFERAKSRLRPALSDEACAKFAHDLFGHVVGALLASAALEGVLVATDADSVAGAARALGAEVRRDDGRATGLAAIVDAGLADLAARGARAALVIMADLPELRPDDVRALVAESDRNGVVLVRAADGHHTNALLLAPPTLFPTAFGRDDSFAEHLAAARARGLAPIVVENPRVSFDIDGPDDHARLFRPA
jgi:2-phospho-L-lactate guanylyltransferase